MTIALAVGYNKSNISPLLQRVLLKAGDSLAAAERAPT